MGFRKRPAAAKDNQLPGEAGNAARLDSRCDARR